ncbi:biotin-dependent carboxyltransferase family protein [Jejuia pallidilutea]|uniref:Allophanate hydrolase 2 subunit 2 n=2 Tax=Jejuia pallidilutea TaxID=504487 RepID=A0A090W4X3_9FLAO|nr:biotin-dependent carboxyltransferase family protein [Jejuia pallidilutea]PQV50367.1 biotin-dependent carboxylase-like uncharacterized protein [Jejuia pallidilutea]GAL72060.1 allophanate hydrolase 2 subunit 2 [Jejuia pallidilutea]GAL88423.1 allophanate hydrolase 2 subunit 2 [Jejuia pallidilutea]
MIKIIKAGFYSSIQDFGRLGHQHYGVPISGVMDKRAARVANTLVGNQENAAVLEITMSGPTLKFNCSSVIAIAGGDLSPKLNGITVKNNKLIAVNKGDVLSFGQLTSGFRSYLAVSGGFLTREVLGSKSMYPYIYKHQTIQNGDVLEIAQKTTLEQKRYATVAVNDAYLKSSTLEVLKGPEFHRLSVTQKKQLFENTFTVSKENNRMAYQLGEILQNNLDPIITSPVLPGTVQLTPAGKLIVLMRDCQTTGGYPRVLQLTDVAINILAQKYTGNLIGFKLIS